MAGLPLCGEREFESHLSCATSASTFWLTRMSYQEGIIGYGRVAGGPGCRRRQVRLTGEKRGGQGCWPRRLGRRLDYQGEREKDWRHKVGHGAWVQVPAGKNDHGDSERR